MCCAQPRELEPADDVLESHLLERLSQGIVDGILVPRRDPSEVRLDLRPESLDRRVVRSVGPGARAWHPPALRPPRRHKPDGGTGCPTRPRHRRAAPVPVLVRHTTRTPRCRSTPGTPAGHALRPVPTRRSRSATPTSRGPSRRPARRAGPSRRPGSSPWSPPSRPRKQAVSARPASPSSGRTPLLPDVGPVALVGVLGLLLGSQAAPAQGAPDSRQAAVEAALQPKLVQGVVVVLLDEMLQAPLVVRAQDRGRAASVRLGGQRVLLTSPLQQPGDERDADSEEAGDLALRALALVHRRRDSLPQVHRIGAHGRYLLIRCRLLPRSCPSISIVSVRNPNVNRLRPLADPIRRQFRIEPTSLDATSLAAASPRGTVERHHRDRQAPQKPHHQGAS